MTAVSLKIHYSPHLQKGGIINFFRRRKVHKEIDSVFSDFMFKVSDRTTYGNDGYEFIVYEFEADYDDMPLVDDVVFEIRNIDGVMKAIVLLPA